MFKRFLILVFNIYLSQAFAGITTAEITAETLKALPNCLHYQIKGLCYWVDASGVTITTPYIAHYLPDVGVSVFNSPGDKNGGNPWREINATLDQAGKIAQDNIIAQLSHIHAGGGEHAATNSLQPNVFFKEADVIGNPALEALPDTPVLLPTTATPFKPYYQSMLDSALWRGFPPQAVPQQLAAITENITHYIGNSSGAINWGGAFPIEGKVQTSHDTKAAAVIAQRAVNLLTAKNSWGHIYQPLSTSCGTECYAAKISENNPKIQFQMVYPVTQNHCLVFGQTAEYGEDIANKNDGAYVWVLWRHYEGCMQLPGGTFIGKT